MRNTAGGTNGMRRKRPKSDHRNPTRRDKETTSHIPLPTFDMKSSHVPSPQQYSPIIHPTETHHPNPQQSPTPLHNAAMFGRRRPVLGTALIVGASRGAARREVSKQTTAQQQQSAQNSDDVDRQVADKLQEEEDHRREKEEQEARIQKAVDEAVRKAGVEQPKPVVLAPEGGPAEGRRGSFVAGPLVLNGGAEVMPVAAREVGGVVGETLFCGKCGLKGEVGDGFCRRCGMGLRG